MSEQSDRVELRNQAPWSDAWLNETKCCKLLLNNIHYTQRQILSKCIGDGCWKFEESNMKLFDPQLDYKYEKQPAAARDCLLKMRGCSHSLFAQEQCILKMIHTVVVFCFQKLLKSIEF